MILKFNDKEFKLVPRTRKVIDLTKRLNTKNLNDLIFVSLSDGNIEVLAELIKAFAEYEDKTSVFGKIEDVYDFIDAWREESGKSYVELYGHIAEVVNEMGFFKNKMTKEELEKMLKDPIPVLNLQELISNSAQKAMDQIAQEEFRGFKG